MQLQLDNRTQAMHRLGASRILQSFHAAAPRCSSTRQSLVATASTYTSPAASSTLSPVLSSVSSSCPGRTVGAMHYSRQQLPHVLSRCPSSSARSWSRSSSVLTSAVQRQDGFMHHAGNASCAGRSSSSSSNNGASAAAAAMRTQASYSSSSSAASAVQPSQRRYNTRSSTDSSSSKRTSPKQGAPSALDKQQHSAVQKYLSQLNEEQQLAAYSPEQHVRVIAGGLTLTSCSSLTAAALVQCHLCSYCWFFLASHSGV
jgi:hypothetical protein